MKTWNLLTKKLRKLIQWVEIETRISFTITSLFRIDDPGVHGILPLRGVDLRVNNYLLGKCIETLINKHWRYDHTRPGLKCALFHDIGKGFHLHLQTHSNTTYI
jgi:hypothetical protein